MQTSIKIKFRPSRVSGCPGSLYVQLIKARKSCVTVLKGIRIYPHEWDDSRESFRLNTAEPDRKAYLEELFVRLVQGKQKLFDIAGSFENRGEPYTLTELVRLYRSGKACHSLSAYALEVSGRIEAQQRRTARSYRSTVNKVRSFNQGKDVMLEELTPEFIRSFEAYMRGMGNSPNTTSYYCRNLRALLNRAVTEKLIPPLPENPFAGVFTGNGKTEKRAVRKEVIDRLRALDLSAGSPHHRLEPARDMFLLSYYLRGISFVDLAHLQTDNLSDGCITYIRRKTGQRFEIEITPQIRSLLDKYHPGTGGYLLPLIRDAGQPQAYESVLRRTNNQLKQLSRLLGLDRPLTTYVARHSWASIAYAMHIPVELISQGLGHENSKTTLIYLKSFDYSSLHEANRQITGVDKKVA